MGKVILQCKGLNKKFGKKQIIKNVSFEIKEGDILGFIGPNRSRKNDDNKIDTRFARDDWRKCYY